MAGNNLNAGASTPVTTPPNTQDDGATIALLKARNEELEAQLNNLENNPMRHLLDIVPLPNQYDFDKILKSYDNDELNAFGAILGSLELDLKARNIEIGVNQARDKDGKGRESQAGISKKGSVEFFSVRDLLHLPPALLDQLGTRNLLKIVGGKTDWLGKDEIVAQAGTATAMSFTR